MINDSVFFYQVPKRIIGYEVILLCLIVITVIFGFFVKIEREKTYTGQVIKEKNNYYVSLYQAVDSYEPLESGLKINGKDVYYEVINISDEYIINNQKYYQLILKVDLDKKYKIENNLVKLDFKLPKKTVFEILKEKFKKGMM